MTQPAQNTRVVRAGFTASRATVLDAIAGLGIERCGYSWGDTWAARCDCKYGGFEAGERVGSEQTGCPELRSLYVVIDALTDDEWALLVHRANGTPRGYVFEDDIGSRLHRAEAAAAMAAANVAEVRKALSGAASDQKRKDSDG